MPLPPPIPAPFELAARQFDLVIRRLADDLTYGSDPSRFIGPGVEYAQTRPYLLGDSVRSIDWKVTARTGKYHVKDYEAPKRVPLYIIVDTSSSMAISSTSLSKQAAASWIAGALSLVAFRRRNPVALLAGGERDVVPPPTLSRDRLYRTLDAIRAAPVEVENTSIAVRLAHVEALADRTSLVIVISDLHDPAAIAAITRVGQRHDCLVLHTIDPAERGGLGAGFIRAAEAETGESFHASGSSRFIGDPADRVFNDLAEAGVDHAAIYTDEPLVPPIRRALSVRGGGRLAR